MGQLGGLLDRAAGQLIHVRLDRVSPLTVPVLVMIGRESLPAAAPTKTGADRSAPVSVAGRAEAYSALRACGDLPNSEYCSFPTKPNLVTPEALMMLIAAAESL